MRCKGLDLKPNIQIFPNEKPENEGNFEENEENYDENFEKKEEENPKKKEEEISIEKNAEFCEKSEILATFLIKILKGFEKLLRKEEKSSKKERISFVKTTNFQEKISEFARKANYNVITPPDVISHVFFEEIRKLDEKYPVFIENPEISSIFSHEFDEILLRNSNFEEILIKIQKIADFLVKNMKNLTNSVESMKKELFLNNFLQRKREKEFENWLDFLVFSQRKLFDIHKEKILREFPLVSQLEFELKNMDFQKQILIESEKILNKGDLYENSMFLTDKLKKSMGFIDFSRKIKDFSLMNSLKILEKYTSNSNVFSEEKIEEKPCEFIKEIFEKEEKKGDFVMKNEISFEKIREKPKILINFNELSEIKKNKRENEDFSMKSPIKIDFLCENGQNSNKNSPFMKKTPANSMIKFLENEILNEMKKTQPKSPENQDFSPLNFNEAVILKNPKEKIETSKENSTEKIGKLENLEEKLEKPLENDEDYNEKALEKPRLSQLSSENSRIIPNNLIKSVFDKNSIKTRQNTIQLKEGHHSNKNSFSHTSKNRFEELKSGDLIKKKSEINDEETLLKFLDKEIENF